MIGSIINSMFTPDGPTINPNYQGPKREWVALTDEEFNDAINYKLTPRCIAIAVEAKLKEKNT